MNCPRCGSPHVTQRHAGKYAGGKLGALLGAAFGAASAMRGTRIGFATGSVLGPAGAVAGGITGAVVTGIFTGSALSAFASAVGHLFDREVLCDLECKHCGNVFRSFEGEFASVTPTAEAPDDPRGSPSNEKRGFFTRIVAAARA